MSWFLYVAKASAFMSLLDTECWKLYLNLSGYVNLYCQYHACWCPGSLRRPVISRHDIDVVIQKYSGLLCGSHPGIFWMELGIIFLSVSGESHCEVNSQINSLWPSDDIWRHRYGLTLAQVMVCCLTASSRYLNQCWLKVFYGIRLRAISQEAVMNLTQVHRVYDMCLEITISKLLPHLPGANQSYTCT